MRVIAGTAKGHRLQAVPGDATRPITDRVKEALLDLFAGTGAVGIEALSRGAAQAVFIDRSPVALRTIRANLQHTRLMERASVLRADAFKYLAGPVATPFDLIYIAPPQYRQWWSEVLRRLDAHPEWLSQPPAGEGLAIVQIHPVEYRELTLQNLAECDRRKYGSTLLCFYTGLRANKRAVARSASTPSQ